MPSESNRPLPRRAMFAASGIAVLTAAAACSSGATTAADTSSATGAAADEATTSIRPSSTRSSAAPSTTSGAAAASTESAPPAGEVAPTGTPLVSVADVQAAVSVVVEAADGPLLLAFADGTVVAHTAVCTHQQCTIAASGMCPCHGSRFDVTTGAVQNGPALRPLAQERVTVTGGQVYPA